MASVTSRRSNPYLKSLFRKFNKRYFGGALPASTRVLWVTEAQMLKECDKRVRRAPAGLFFYDTAGEDVRNVRNAQNNPIILLDITMKRNGWWAVAKLTLFHEMVHLQGKGRDSHGPAFDKRMLELAKKKAFHRLW